MLIGEEKKCGLWMRRKVEEKKKVAESHSTKEWKKIIKENERLVGCKKLASLFFSPKKCSTYFPLNKSVKRR